MQRVFVGLSGGVDSAVSAALLRRAGYDVVGAFIKIWRPEFIECPWQKERLDAMRVAAHLEIPFTEIDLSDEYKAEVIDRMISDYEQGITPNPDILCNRHIKFGAFTKWAHEEGADLVATGHYAQVKKVDTRFELHRGVDANKDQSYFLSKLTEADLKTTLFPVGGYAKKEVRLLAEKFNLPVARKHDSQGLCFVGEVTMRDFLARYITLEKGAVVDEAGKTIGEHDGAALYTLGERHGFRIKTVQDSEVPHYVIALNTSTNTVMVAPEKEKAFRSSAELKRLSWVNGEVEGAVLAQARYRETPIPASVKGNTVTLTVPHLLPPGQSLVMYEGDRLVGSGDITAEQ